KDFGQFAQRISDKVKAHAEEMAEQQGRPFIYVPSSKQSKEEIARAIMEKDNIKGGLICVLTCVEPCQSFRIRKDAARKTIHLAVAERKCTHIYFYLIDPQCGFMHIRLQTWLPLSIQVCLNAREYLACEMTKAGIKFEREKNCFPWIEDIQRAQQLMDKLTTRKWERFLSALARRVNPWLNPKGD